MGFTKPMGVAGFLESDRVDPNDPSFLGGNDDATRAGIGIVGRNLLINGSARIAQRGAGPFTSATAYPNNDDRFLFDGVNLLSDGNDIVDVSQETTIVPGDGYASIKFEVETADKKFGILLPVEAREAKKLIGGNAVASFSARKGSSNATLDTLRAAIISWAGTADAITSDVVSAWGAEGTNPTLATSWTYETVPKNLVLTTAFQRFKETNGLAGAIDTASTKQFALFIWCDNADCTVDDTVYITHWQIERGLVAGEFEHVPLPLERLICERYFRRVGGSAGTFEVIGEGVGIGATSAEFVVKHPVQMRANPVLTVSDATAYALNGIASTTIAISGALNSSSRVTLVAIGVAAGLTSGLVYRLNASTANQFLDFSAEL